MGYYITIKNNLLDPKHIEAMGSSVWLYMWLIDKVMAINENGVGKVLNGRPVTYERIIEDLGISKRTCQRWLKQLEDSKYIRTIQAPYGHVIYVNKAAKMWGQKSQPNNVSLFDDERVDKNVQSKDKKPAKKRKVASKMSTLEWTKVSSLHAKNVHSNNDNSNRQLVIDSNTENKFSESQQIGILYYEVIKKLGLPVSNHNTIKSKIQQLQKEDEVTKVVNYLIFMRDYYNKWKWKYKPVVNTALDLYSKRLQIRNAAYDYAKKTSAKEVAEI